TGVPPSRILVTRRRRSGAGTRRCPEVGRRVLILPSKGLALTPALSMNLKTLALILKGLRVSGSWSQCMRKKTERGLSMNHGSGAAVPPAAGASRPRIYRGRDARAGSRDGCPITERRFMVPMRAQKRKEALHEANALGKRRRRGVFIGRAIQRIVLNTC